MSVSNYFNRGALALILALSGCGDDDKPAAQTECGNGTSLVLGECVSDTSCGTNTVLMNGVCVPLAPVTTYRQIEHLARPGIAEALLITPAYLAGYNATAPSFAGAPADAVAAITAEAKTVLKALYLGACLLNGVIGLDRDNGVKPAGLTCVEVGRFMFTNDMVNGTTLKTTVAAGAQAYADRVFGQFELDVMRIDTAVDSAYLTLCSGAAANVPLLCGGRKLNEDVIDITYFYLLAGAAFPTAATTPPNAVIAAQATALVSDGVFFSTVTGENSGALGTPAPANLNQFKQSCANCEDPRVRLGSTFPYSAPPH